MVGPSDLAVVILAGGRATRFPGKLEASIEGEPLLARVYRNLRGCAPVFIAARDTFCAHLDAHLDCPIVIDRWPDRGPLGGLLSACGEVRAERVFAVAGDMPRVTSEVLHALLQAWQSGDEAAVAQHEQGIEPLAALYDRAALVREGRALLESRTGSMHALLDRLKARRVPMDARFFVNINTAADLGRAQS